MKKEAFLINKMKILVAVDETAHSMRALQWALKNLATPKADSVCILSIGLRVPDWYETLDASYLGVSLFF